MTSAAPESFAGHDPWPDGYQAFFRLFNGGRYFEAHEALEEAWLLVRGTPAADFYKALIQIAGALVHVQQARPGPACRLLRRAAELLDAYRPRHMSLHVVRLQERLARWQEDIAAGRLTARELEAQREACYQLVPQS